MACHFVDPCVLNNNYGSCARIVGIMHSIESAIVKDLGVETAMLVVTVKERDKFMNKVLGEVVGKVTMLLLLSLECIHSILQVTEIPSPSSRSKETAEKIHESGIRCV